jgi:hypothetical protein
MVSCFIARSLYMFQALSVPIIRSTLTAFDSHWCNMLRWIVNFVVRSTLRVVQNLHSDVTNRPIWDSS